MMHTAMPPLIEQLDELEDAHSAYMWKRELTLTQMMGNLTLGDPGTSPPIWCAKFSKWRYIHKVPAHAAVLVLQSHLPVATYREACHIEMEWMKLGKSKPQTAQDWEDFLAFSLKLVSAQACWGRAPTGETVSNEREDPVQRHVRLRLPQTGQRGESEDLSEGYTWKNELALTKLLGSATLVDPNTDRVLWCANFRNWRDIHKVPAHAAIVVLHSHFADAAYWEIGNIDAEWMHLGRSQPKTAQDWEDYLTVSLALVSAQELPRSAQTREALKNELDKLAQCNKDTAQSQTPTELKIEFPSLRKYGEVSQPNDMSYGYSWKSELTLTKILGDVTLLNDPDADPMLWCANFRKWRAIKAVSAKVAVAVLHVTVPSTVSWEIGGCGIEEPWIVLGRSEPQTAQDWEDLLALSLKLVSDPPYGGLRGLRGINREWENLVQGNKNTRQFANCILKLADNYKRLNPHAPRSIHDFRRKLLEGANPSTAVFLHLALLLIEETDMRSPNRTMYAFYLAVRASIAFDPTYAVETHSAA